MSKLVATDEAVRVKTRKSELINGGAGALSSAWNVLELNKYKQFRDREIRDVEFSTEDDHIVITAYLGKIEESDDEDTTRNSDG